MTTKSKQLRRQHRKSPKRRREFPHPSRTSGMERLHALKPAYIAWRSHTVPHTQARDDWAALLAVLECYAAFEPFRSPDALAPQPFALLLNCIRRMPCEVACQTMDRLDGYLHFLNDNGHWQRGNEVFDVLHMLVLIRVPGRASRTTPRECPVDIHVPHGHGIALVQWAAYLLGGMLEGRFGPDATDPLALPLADLADTNLLAPGLYPLPLSRFRDLLHAMRDADLFETIEDEEDGADTGESHPTHFGMALLQDGHPRNHEAIRSLLSAYLKIVIWADARPMEGLAGLRRAEECFALFLAVGHPASEARAQGESSMLTLAEDIRDQLAERYGDVSPSVLACLQGGVLEYSGGTLVAQRVVREAVRDLNEEYHERRRPADPRGYTGSGRPS